MVQKCVYDEHVYIYIYIYIYLENNVSCNGMNLVNLCRFRQVRILMSEIIKINELFLKKHEHETINTS